MSQAFPPPQQPAGGNPFGQPTGDGAFAPQPAPARSGNVALGVAVGIVAMIAGAAAYGGLMRAFGKEDGTYTEIGYIAVGVGALIGFVVGKLGGRNPALPIVSAVLGVIGVVLGQIFGMALLASWWFEIQLGQEISVIDLLTENPGDTFKAWREEADVMTWLFLAIGGIVGFTSAKKAGN
ncbi:hypothetical protein [Streptomyces sp. N35]|uniref:hypothetical protein n=1 Tax=Streptomyces sp. N35 TaxID=2795730 RepID=UPI0018F412AD|nr:hypothetical protein [Streptomyces sp. N35]